jgi:methionine synthase reductase
MGLEGTVEPWIPRIVDALRALATAAQSGEATPTASVAATTVPAPVAAAAAPDADAGADPDADPDADAALDAAAAEEWAMHEGGSALRPHDARVLAAEWLTVDEDGRRVMTLTLDLSRCEGPSLRGLTPGDALAVTPHNDSGDVAAVLDALGVNPGEARQPLALGADAERPAHLRTVDSDPEPLSLERLLTERCDIGSAAGWPRPALLRVLAEAATEASEAAALQALTRRAPGAHRPSLAELLANYPSARPPLVRLVNALPPLAERLYSLASASTDGSARIVFTAVVYAVRDATGALVSRRGLCSGMLAAKGAEFLKSGGWLRPCVRVYRRRPTGNELRLPAALSAPLLMVGPGTGVAPFLSFLQHRAALIAAALQPPAEPAARGAAGAVGAAAVVGESHLFFGCQHQVGDFLFSKELREMERAGTLTRLHTVRRAPLRPPAFGLTA